VPSAPASGQLVSALYIHAIQHAGRNSSDIRYFHTMPTNGGNRKDLGFLEHKTASVGTCFP